MQEMYQTIQIMPEQTFSSALDESTKMIFFCQNL